MVFVDSVVLEPEAFLRYGDELFAQHPVREVQFLTEDGQPAGPDGVEDLVAAPAFARVRSLDTSGAIPSSGPAWCRALARSPRLTRLEEVPRFLEQLGARLASSMTWKPWRNCAGPTTWPG